MAKRSKASSGGRRAPAQSSRTSHTRAADDRPSTRELAPAFVQDVTFFGVPRPSGDVVPDADVLLAGVPYDGGTLARPGARYAPRAIREASIGFGPYAEALGVGAWDEIRVADAGDIPIGGLSNGAALDAITRRAEAIARSGVIGGFVGGDQTITLGALRGINRAKLKAVGLVHIDARVDMSGPSGRSEVHQFSALRKATEEGLLKSDALIHVGVRGPHDSARELDLSAAAGFETVKADDVRWDIHAAVSQIRKIVRKGSLYVSVDVAALDPAFAPGASHRRPGGMTTWELQQVLRALVGAQIVGFDVVEVSPPHDASGLTALAAACAVHEILAVIADTRRSARHAPTSRRRRRGRRMSA